LGHIATAAGIPPATLRTWLYRNFLCHERGDERGKGPGHYARFTLRTALRVALTAEQVRWGVHAQLAGQNARKFTDMDHGRLEWIDELADAEQPWRNPGECYQHGSTWFVLQSATGFASVIHVPTDRDTKDLIADLIPPSQFSVLIIDLNTLVFRVRYCLSACAQLVIDAKKTPRGTIAGVIRAHVPAEPGVGTAGDLDDPVVT
jgi:hypothetical protein